MCDSGTLVGHSWDSGGTYTQEVDIHGRGISKKKTVGKKSSVWSERCSARDEFVGGTRVGQGWDKGGTGVGQGWDRGGTEVGQGWWKDLLEL
eukprot:893275-Amorphochlora_amoeboformis.AAC.1